MIRASIGFEPQPWRTWGKGGHLCGLESHTVKDTLGGLESHTGDGRLNWGLSLIEDPISTAKVESYEHAWTGPGLDVSPFRNWCVVIWIMIVVELWELRCMLPYNCEIVPHRSSLRSLVDLSWIWVEHWLEPCRAEWTHRIGELTEIIISSHYCCYFSGILYRLNLRETVMDVSRVAVHYDLPLWSCVQWRYCT